MYNRAVSRESQRELLDLCGGREGIARLFDFLTMCQVYGKDYRGVEQGQPGRFFFANSRFLNEKGLHDDMAIFGKTDFDYYPSELAAQYIAEDAAILKSGRGVIGQAWLVVDQGKRARVWKSSKLPIFSEGRAVAIIGAMYEVSGESVAGSWGALSGSLVYIQNHLSEKLTLEELAGEAGYSVSRFTKLFREIFEESPHQYIKRMRATLAAKKLLESNQSIGDIALASGYYDHSHFVRQFREVLGMSPKEYRKRGETIRYRESDANPLT